MTDLTEQWKKGELPECEYYIQDKEGNTSTMHLWNDERCKLSVRCKRLSILAPVPSYEEWQAKLEENAQLKEQINKCCLDAINRGTANTVKAVKEFGMPERIEELVKQNAQLKELLKECSIANTALVSIMDWLRKSTIPEQRENCEKLFEKTQELQKRLDEVLK